MLMVGSSKFVTVNFDCKEGSGHLHLHTLDFMMSVFSHGRKGFAEPDWFWRLVYRGVIPKLNVF